MCKCVHAQPSLTLATSWAVVCQALLYDISYMWNLKNTPTSDYTIRGRLTNIENKLMVTEDGQYKGRGLGNINCWVLHNIRNTANIL